MSEIKDRQDAASDIDPIVAALADDTHAAAAVEGFDETAEPVTDEAALAEVGDPAALVADAADLPEDRGDASDALVADSLGDVARGEAVLVVASDEPLYPEPRADADFGDEAPGAAIASTGIAAVIEAALVDDVPQSPAATALEHLPAAYADTIVELDPEADSADDDAPLLDSDLEDGIASVFAALHAAREDSAPVQPLGDLEAADGVTFRLLGELDRLWHRAA